MKNIFKNWNALRFIRLGLGLLMVFSGIIQKDSSFIIMGGVFSLMPIFNIGCCGMSSCSTNVPRKNTLNSSVQYEEVIEKK